MGHFEGPTQVSTGTITYGSGHDALLSNWSSGARAPMQMREHPKIIVS